MSKPTLNTDTELWREPQEDGSTDYYSNSVHHTSDNKLGINVGGHVIVRSLEDWHKLAQTTKPTDTQELELGDPISEIIATYLEGLHNPSDDNLYNDLRAMRDTKALKEAIEQNYILKSKVREAIGEDDPTTPGSYYINSDAHITRNQLRHQIKSALGLEEEEQDE